MAYTDIDDPSAYFTIALYTGTSDDSVKTVTNDANAGDFKPDWLWIKGISGTYAAGRNHSLYDSSRGATLRLESSTTNAEGTDSDNTFTTNGFTLSPNYSINGLNTNHVGFQWKANGGTTASNTDGSITSTVQANTDAGFSIVSFTGTGATTTVGHGLGVTPKFFIIKSRSTGNWWTYTTVIDGSLDYLQLETTNAKANSGLTAPTSSVFSVNSSVAPNTENIIAYCFTSIQGYSKIGSYVGNGNVNGAFVYTGFKPAWVLVKSVDVAQSWQLSDSARNPFNVVNRRIAPNDTSAESTVHSWIDFLSNGFKIRINDAAYNNNGQDYIYMAFAEHPFVSSNGVPTTAR